eukprot:766395-Hanusia_phi.AAC.8
MSSRCCISFGSACRLVRKTTIGEEAEWEEAQGRYKIQGREEEESGRGERWREGRREETRKMKHRSETGSEEGASSEACPHLDISNIPHTSLRPSPCNIGTPACPLRRLSAAMAGQNRQVGTCDFCQ